MIIYSETRVTFILRHLLNRLVPRLRARGKIPAHPVLCVYAQDLIGRETAVAGLYEVAGLEAVRDLVRTGVIDSADTQFMDIGANIGTYCVALAADFTSVAAFEPHPITRRLLELNIELNEVRNCDVFPFALSNCDGVGELLDTSNNMGAATLHPDNNVSPGGGRNEVELRVGDDVVAERAMHKVGFIKIDVEGHEFPVVEGLIDTIRRDQPVIAFEANTGAEAESVREKLTELGYVQFLGLGFHPRVKWMPLRVLLLLILGVRHGLMPVHSLTRSKYSLVFALTQKQSARLRF